MSYMSDRTILPRLQEHLLSNQEKTYIDLNLVSDELQQKYKEYAKRKRSAFRASVGKAYSIILQRHGLEDVQGYEREIIVKNPLVDTSNQFLDNLINRQLTDLYSSNLNQQENAFIPISSDEAENTTPITKITAVARGSVVQETSSLFNRAGSNKNSLNGNEIDNHNKQPPGNIRVKKNKLKISDTPIGKINRKRKKSVGIVHNSTYSFKNIGGMAKTLEEICKIILHMRCPEIYKTIGVSPPRGLLLHGPPGCGKTLLANAIAGELNVPILKVSAPELVAGVSGESEERIRELFDQAVELQPCVLFIDEIDVITPSRDNAQKEMERRIVAQLVSCLDDLNENNNLVFVMGASNRLDSIDKALRRAGRFDREISLGFPDTQARTKILKTLSTNLRLTENFDFETIALYTPGFVGADLLSLIREAAMVAINRSVNMYQNHKLNEVASEMGINVTTDEIIKNNEINDNESLNINKVNAQSNSEPITNTLCTKDTSTEINVTDIPDPTKMVDLQNISFNSLTDNGKLNEAKLNPEITPTTDKMIITNENYQVVNESSGTQNIEVANIQVVEQKTTLAELLLWFNDKSILPESFLHNLYITNNDFKEALKIVQPTAKREGFATVPNITWDDIGSLRNIREELQMAILAPVRHAREFQALGINTHIGIFLCGPPGCGKTLLAKAIANEAGINFISVKGPELLNMYVGESEKAVRVCFERARNSAPCVIFFDELDALCPKRSDSREGNSTRVVNQMLTEMDGIEGRNGVFLLAASNRPDIIDPAVLRPGRFDKILFVDLPSSADRSDILKAITKNGTVPRLASDVNLEDIGKSEECDGYTGADLAALVREASVIALKEFMLSANSSERDIMVTNDHFKKAILKVRPSVSEKDQKHYEKLRKMYSPFTGSTEMEAMECS